MKKSRKLGCLIAALVFIAVIIVTIFVIITVIEKNLESFSELDFASLDMGTVEDGTYTGSADGSIVKATVEVTVKDHVIMDIKILSHDNGKGKPAEAIVDDIVANNSLEVDVVSGATSSSNIIKAAVLNALTK